MIEHRTPAFIILTEVFQNADDRKIIIPVDMITYIQDGYDGKNTYLRIKDVNENGKGKYFFIGETVDEISGMLGMKFGIVNLKNSA